MADDFSPAEFFERASDDPGAIAFDRLVRSLRSDDDAVRKAAAEALYDVATAEPTRLAEEEKAVPALVTALGDENPLVRERVAMALANVAKESDALAPAAGSLADQLDDDYDIVTDYLACALRCIAGRTPEVVADAVLKLLPALTTEMESTKYHIVAALVAVADRRPDAIRPAVEPLLDVVDGRNPTSGARDLPYPPKADTASFQPDQEPVVADDVTGDLAPRTVEAALIVMAKLAAERPADAATRLQEHVPRLRPLLDDPDGGIRAVTAGIFAVLAEYEPQAVEPATAQLVDRLTDDVATAAGNAAWALRYVETSTAKEALRDANPADDDVRAVVDAALDDL